MPLTRALSARLRTRSQRQSAPSAMDQSANDDVMALKSQAKLASSSSTSLGSATGALVAGALGQLNVQQSASKRTSCCSTASTPTLASTDSTPSRPRYVRGGSSRFSSRSSTSSRRSILGSSDLGDSSDDENDGSSRSRRIGGCSSISSTADRPDDSNKENIAPFRCASQDVLDSEARDAQQEDAIRRTTSTTSSRRSSLMERQTFTAPRRLSRSSTTSDLSASSGKSCPFRLKVATNTIHVCARMAQTPLPSFWAWQRLFPYKLALVTCSLPQDCRLCATRLVAFTIVDRSSAERQGKLGSLSTVTITNYEFSEGFPIHRFTFCGSRFVIL